MKKILYSFIVAVALLVVPTTASAQLNLSRLLGGISKVTSQMQTEQSTENPYSRLAESAPSAYQLNGTWSYQSASFSYLGNNPLADIVIAQVDPIIGQTLQQLGFTAGSVTLRLTNGKGVIMQGEHALNGSYSYTRSKAAIVASTTFNDKSVSASGYVRYSGGQLTVLLDARELINALTTVMPELKQDQNVIMVQTLLKDLKDVYVAGKFSK